MDQRGRGYPARQVADVAERPVQLGLCLLEHSRQGLGVATLGLGSGEIELDARGDEQLLRGGSL